MRLLCAVRSPHEQYDVLVTADPEATVAQLRGALGYPAEHRVWTPRRRLDDQETLAGAGIRDGDTVSVGCVGLEAPIPRRWQLSVVSGPAAGWRLVFDRTDVVVGSAADCDLVLPDELVSARHLRITPVGDGFELCDLGSATGTTLDGVALEPEAAVPLAPGGAVRLGATVLTLEQPVAADADVHDDGAGGLALNRQARLRPHAPEVKVSVPGVVRRPEPVPFPWAALLAPIGLAVVALLVFRRPEMLVFAAMSPMLAVATSITAKRRNRRRHAQEQVRFDEAMVEAVASCDAAVAEQAAFLRSQHPHPGQLVETAAGPGRRCWERRHRDTDAFDLRVGLGSRPADVQLQFPSTDRPLEAPWLHDVPVTVPLRDLGVVGIAGPAARARSVGRWLVAQLATLHVPADLGVVVLCDAEAAPDWQFVRWLPHARDESPQAPIAWIGNDRDTQGERVRDLLRILDARKEASGSHRGIDFVPAVVVVLDGARQLRSIPGMVRVLREGPPLGIFTIGLDDHRTRLPEEARAEIVLDAGLPGLGDLYVDERPPAPGITIDTLSPAAAEAIGRGLAPLRATGGDDETTIPASVRFVDLAGIDLDDVDSIRSRWELSPRSTEALIGVSIDGPFTVDLKRDGPHALVAGTTGAGKSEFLQTLVTSLAYANRPDALNFVLVDYKGASAFADCERLPHTVGLVSNLDGHLTERALVSLDAEVRRREQVLADLAAPDIDSAWQRSPDDAATAGLARLVLVIDEFAELVHELPDFITGLIRIARVGRSLGIHLVLATQRPTGVVSPEMRANTGLRVALRMEDKGDSSEVIDAAVASTIARATPGRAYVRTGAGATLVQFQAARVAGRRPGAAVAAAPAPEVLPVVWRRLGHPLTRPPVLPATEGTATDLHALVALINRAAALDAKAPPVRPWLPPLPATVLLDDLAPASAQPDAGTRPPVVPIGLEDRPAAQAQDPYGYDLAGGSHLAIAGSARSGRSSALRAVAGALASHIAPDDLHLYALDFGNGALRPLADLPHCGAVVSATETDRAERLLHRLSAEVTRRQELFADDGYGDLAEQRAAVAPPERLPYVVILLDRFESMHAAFPVDSSSDVPASITRILREGTAVGFRLVIAGDRTVLSHRDAVHVPTKLVMTLADANDYRLADINPRTVADSMPPGRAMRPDIRSEVQFALLHPDPSGRAQGEALRRLAGRWAAPAPARQPIRVDVTPRRLTAGQLADLPATGNQGPWWIAFGAGGDRLAQHGIDLAASSPGIVIAGPRRSGRSNALTHAALTLLGRRRAVLWLAPRDADAAAAAGRAGAVVLAGAGAKDAAAVKAAIEACSEAPLVCIDDAETFARSEADEWLTTELNAGTTGIGAVIAAGGIDELRNELRGIIPLLKRAKVGVVLKPGSPMDGDLLGARFDRKLLGGPDGRALLGSGSGEPVPVQVPLAGIP